MRFPEPVRKVLSEAGYHVHFTDGPIWDLPFLETLAPWERLKARLKASAAPAATFHLAFGDPRNAMVFGSGVLLDSPTISVGAHEGGHALVNARGLALMDSAIAAWKAEQMKMEEDFRTFSEFSGEATARFYYDENTTRKVLEDLAPRFSAILEEDQRLIQRRANLSTSVPRSEMLYRGPEGGAVYDPSKDAIDIWLTLDGEVIMGGLGRDGKMAKIKCDSRSFGGLTVATTKIVTVPENTTSKVREFLRSKGVTLPHVMS